MNNIDEKTYKEWSATIVNTRLIYNTMSEFEEFLNYKAIGTNGAKRGFSSSQKSKFVYRNFKVEVQDITNDVLCLDEVMRLYKIAGNFYKAHLTRRANPKKFVLDLLHFYFPMTKECIKFGKKKQALFECIMNEDINLPLLILLILKAFPSYDSTEGNVTNISQIFETVINLLDLFTSNGSFFSTLPAITNAKAEKNKCRIMLLYHVNNILSTYDSLSTSEQLYEISSTVKDSSIDFELQGYWNENDGIMQNTKFWKIEHADVYGQFLVSKYHKDSDKKLTVVNFRMFLTDKGDGTFTAYVLHPQAISNKIKGLSYTDEDNVWYTCKMPTELEPSKLKFTRLLSSLVWPLNVNLTRITDEKVTTILDRWIEKDCEIINRFADCEYYFEINLYAITKQALYIPTNKNGWYYRVPIDAAPGLDQIKLTDNVGVMTMGNTTYLTFDELMLFISTSNKSLAKYGINIVNCID